MVMNRTGNHPFEKALFLDGFFFFSIKWIRTVVKWRVDCRVKAADWTPCMEREIIHLEAVERHRPHEDEMYNEKVYPALT